MRRKDVGRNKKAESVRKIGENSKREEIFQKAGAYSAVFFMAFFIALVSASAFAPVDNSEAATTEVNLTSGGYYLRVVSADTVTMDLTATAGGAMAIAKDTITINTNSPGYKVYLSMNSASDTNLWKDGSSSSGYSIRTSDAPVEAPAALDTNRWGWALANPSASASTAIQNYGFDMTYCLSSGTCSDGNPGSLNKNNKFAGMPLSNNPALVAYSTTTATGATQDIYYGVNATTALESGSYTGRVVYTAVGEASSAAKGEMSFDVDNQQSLAGTTRTIATSMYASDVLINRLALSDFSVKIGGKDCIIASKSDIVITSGGTLNITCTTPTMTRWGSYDVVATIGDYGTFDLPKENGYHYYIPYNTMKTAASGAYKMQEFTTKTCSEMPTPAAYSGTPGTSNYHVVGSYYDKSKPSWYDENGNETMTNPVAQLILTDSRDGRTYQVRKYADGNCWMAQNLELTFYVGDGSGWSEDNVTVAASYASGKTVLTSDDTDLHTTESIDVTTGKNAEGETVATFYATQKATGGKWDAWGVNEARSFSREGYNADRIYAMENGVNSYGQITYTTVAASAEPNNGQETRSANLYNWTTATLGSGLDVETYGAEVEDSICPAHWQLPTNGTRLTNLRGLNYSFYNLVKTYYGSAITGNPRGTDIDVLARVTEQNLLRSEPISLIVSGDYHPTVGTLNSATTISNFWTATAGDNGGSLALRSSDDIILFQSNLIRGFGFPVRCVAR